MLRAGNRCEYCQMHQSMQGATFHVEHIVPRSAGGSDDIGNLAWACPSCNLHKAGCIAVELVGMIGQITLYNPRRDRWSDHFQWEDFVLVARSDIGRATLGRLNLNHERRLKIRQAEQLFELFPHEVL
ncbi:HNH endonuclease [Novipirellula aureliae]|uniref:HNH endonuclease n=2 Tax=Novipirellula aureliae TaxID=2527966 RepID=A0A5C6DLP9_9BACT|nr:HNH endonuclease [Novipirellula aureliae]